VGAIDYNQYYEVYGGVNTWSVDVYSGQTTEVAVPYQYDGYAFSLLLYSVKTGYTSIQTVTVQAGASVDLGLETATKLGNLLVNLSIAGLPAGMTASYSCPIGGPASCTTSESSAFKITLNTDAQLAPGTYMLQITATGQGTTGFGVVQAYVQVQ
jgi:hypothetical protein